MSKLISDTDPDTLDHNVPVFSVSEVSLAVKQTVEGAFRRVRVRGELSGFKRAASGHLYFTLKDEDAVLDGVCWKGTAARLRIKPDDGMEVIATGRITTYAGRSKYQMVVESMELAGEGALLKLLEDRRKRLAEEGLFETERKQDLPYLPDVIGVVTSPTGAVIRDILHRINDRFPRRVLLWPVVVQGDTAAPQIAAAIRGFNAIDGTGLPPRPDVLIVARGGGSLEDLWAFNEEEVVRAAADSNIPLISAVGHETDTTLIDFAADRRAPTPTAAAEIAVPVRLDLVNQLTDESRRLSGAMLRQLNDARSQLEGLARGLPNLRRLIDEATQRLDDWEERLSNSLTVGLRQRDGELKELIAALRHPEPIIARASARIGAETRALRSAMRVLLKEKISDLKQPAGLLESYSYRRTLERGFALVTDTDGRTVRRTADLPPGTAMSIELYDGAVPAVVTGNEIPTPASSTSKPGRESAKKTQKAEKSKGGKDDRQGSLL